MEPKKHIGKRTRVKYIGGDYHGEEKQVRAPIREVVEVARPPKYIGDNQYDPNRLDYQTYFLFWDDDTDTWVYVWSEWADDYKKDPVSVTSREYESDNNKAIRLEKEEQERIRKLMETDFKTWGFAITVNDKRVHPGQVKLYVNVKHKNYEQMFIKKEKLYDDE
jgi:hypothetical protein